ncbi:hypothetical protein MAR_012829 [Mya arenaria]|uniref:Uncharacterized protein n=1 Tax=Mya arenaria TaxID=6604 RepID=A0ABY7FY87_MYAAR|nr:hypothetical protein MAR_012829 [Mya arenaria]
MPSENVNFFQRKKTKANHRDNDVIHRNGFYALSAATLVIAGQDEIVQCIPNDCKNREKSEPYACALRPSQFAKNHDHFSWTLSPEKRCNRLEACSPTTRNVKPSTIAMSVRHQRFSGFSSNTLINAPVLSFSIPKPNSVTISRTSNVEAGQRLKRM